MLGLTWSLGFLPVYATIVAFAATPAHSDTTSASGLVWAESILDGLNSSSPSFSTALSSGFNLSSSIGLSNRGPVHCFENPPAPTPPGYAQILILDYLGALEKIVAEDDALSFLSWTFRPGDKKTWTSNRCGIAVGVPHRAARKALAVFQPVVIAHLAGKVARECFKPGRTLGGYVAFGDYQELTVVLGAMRSNVADTATS